MHCLKHFFLQTEEELDPEDVELDEHYTIETRSKCKTRLSNLISFGHKYHISSLDSGIRVFFYCKFKRINFFIQWILKCNADGKGHLG
jgi:hypothetical protein